jgi:anti-sigma regulatory factor (Ser/Thr protein kinase)
MGKRDVRNQEIQSFILTNLRGHPGDIARLVAEHFQISRQAALKHLAELTSQGQIVVSGTTRDRAYTLAPTAQFSKCYQRTAELEEDKIWRTEVRPLLDGVRPNVVAICQYGFTEILNNAIEHSEASAVAFEVIVWPDLINLVVSDNGVGIFNKIQRELHLDDPLHAILELSKGKLTTDPSRHSGEGIFFTSRVFDRFEITSYGLQFTHRDEGFDVLMEGQEPIAGTKVKMGISAQSERVVDSVFSAFSVEPEEYGFDRTVVPVALARYGDENLVSRSQARRLLARFERFREVVLDFSQVSMIGQAFADEIFRVFQSQHPEIHLVTSGANQEIQKMIARVTTPS